MNTKKLAVVLCWHMHQPHYREGINGPSHLPWAYLHAIKDYTDMAAHLEANPAMRLVVNFAPSLLEQIEDYALQLADLLNTGKPCADELLNLLSGVTPIPADSDSRQKIISDCQRCYAPTMIDTRPEFSRLLEQLSANDSGDAGNSAQLETLSSSYFVDLLCQYHLTWLGASLRQQPEVIQLLAHTGNFNKAQRLSLLSIMQQAIAGIIPRYRTLSERGQIELSMTPYAHPIVPLLNDLNNMKAALPDAPMPQASHYPGGVERNHWHMQQGLEVFKRHFGIKPRGIWLSEGGISDDALDILDEYDIDWTASGQGVWGGTCYQAAIDQALIQNKKALFSPFAVADKRSKVFFRDDGMSDFIGFEYSQWDAQQAAEDFVGNLRNIHAFLGDDADEHVISIILDGENAWEYFPDNASKFLDALYNTMTNEPLLETQTFASICDDPKKRALPVASVAAGSWVYGSFSTWIGEPDKNRAWDYLIDAKHCFDRILVAGTLGSERRQSAERQLAICEGSDWFWWFGDHHSADSVRDFDQLFRIQLRRLYALLGEAPPEYLNQPISHGGSGSENGGTMQRGVA